MEQTIETWRDAIGYEGLYRVSDLGRVRSLDRVVDGPKGQMRLNGKVMKLSLVGGYEQIGLCKNGPQKFLYVHRLVAAAFIGPRPNEKQVNHRDGNKLNNRSSNLEYVTARENIHHAWRMGLSKTRGTEHPASKLTEENVLAIREAHAAGGVSQKKLADKYGVSAGSISFIVNRQTWAHLPPA